MPTKSANLSTKTTKKTKPRKLTFARQTELLARYLCEEDGHKADMKVYKTILYEYNTPNGKVCLSPIDSAPMWWHYTAIASNALMGVKKFGLGT